MGYRFAYSSMIDLFSNSTDDFAEVVYYELMLQKFDKKFNYELINIARMVRKHAEYEDQIQDVALLIENSKVVY